VVRTSLLGWVGIVLIAGGAVVAAPAPARADEAVLDGPPELVRARPMREQLADVFDEVGAAIDEHLDTRHRRGRIRVRGEVARAALALDSNVRWERGGAHVTARIDLRLGDHAVRIDVPEFEVRPTSVDGERGVEVRVPLITGTF
jgi:hypothetical protein